MAPLVDAIKAQGWSVWWDPAIIPGEEFDQLIRQEIKAAHAVLVVWTPTSIASRWVRGEARIGADRGILVPVRFDGAELPIDAMAIHTTDLDAWNEDTASPSFQELMQALMRHLKDVPRKSRDAGQQTSICVLPFANMSNDAEQEYFADGISEDIITDLSKVSALSVISRNTAFTFKGKHVDLKAVAKQVGVTHVLEGSVRKSGNRLRITAQLIDAKRDSHIWAERYDRDLDDIFALQDEISEAIVSALKVKLLPEEKKAIEDRGTNSVEAYDRMLRARALFSQGSKESIARAIALVREAVAIDPGFLGAWGQLSGTLIDYSIIEPQHRVELLKEAETIHDRIASLDQAGALGLTAGAQQLFVRRDFLEAERLFQKVGPISSYISSGPNVRASTLFGQNVGRFSEVLKGFRELVRHDPLSLLTSIIFQEVLDIVGLPDEAQTEYERSKDLVGDRVFAEFNALMRMKGRSAPHEIAAQWQRLIAIDAIGIASVLESESNGPNDPAGACRVMRRLYDEPQWQNPTAMLWLAHLADFFDDTDLALAALHRTYIEMNFLVVREVWHPVHAKTRKDPRFKQLVRDLKLYDYWKKSGKWGDFARPLGEDDFEITG